MKRYAVLLWVMLMSVCLVLGGCGAGDAAVWSDSGETLDFWAGAAEGDTAESAEDKTGSTDMEGPADDAPGAGVQADGAPRTEVQSDDVLSTGVQSDDALLGAGVQSDDALRAEVQSDDALRAEVQSDGAPSTEVQSDDALGAGVQSGGALSAKVPADAEAAESVDVEQTGQGSGISVAYGEAYDDPDHVALYIHLYGELPSNYITKNEARDLGWDSGKGNLWEIVPGASIGGDRFGNREGLLPEKKGRKYYECDVNYEGGYRGGERIVYSSDGLVYYSEDHYENFELWYDEEGPAE